MQFGGFGLGILVRQGFLGAKAPLQSVFATDTAFFSAKAQNSRIRLAPNSRNSLPVFCGGAFWGFVGLVLVVVLWVFLFFTGTDCFGKKFKEQKKQPILK